MFGLTLASKASKRAKSPKPIIEKALRAKRANEQSPPYPPLHVCTLCSQRFCPGLCSQRVLPTPPFARLLALLAMLLPRAEGAMQSANLLRSVIVATKQRAHQQLDNDVVGSSSCTTNCFNTRPGPTTRA